MCSKKVFNTKWSKKFTVPILLFVGIGLVIWLIFSLILDTSEKSTINWITIFGTYTSIYALGIALYQIFSLMSISERTKKAITNNIEVVNQVVIFSEISKNIRFLREAKYNINTNEYRIAILRMCDVKDSLTRLDTVLLGKIEEDNPNFLSNLGVDISNIEDALYREKKIEERIIANNIENLISSISKCDYKIKNILVYD